ncbi:competence type IV pilus minor pilin ComGG [Bacillus sp. T33-2]|uniref:competence type IV pilus minor pilin ComGG n=1 Tax=Bacillus sp. T33-2 TaxID=2054168 RepID=UPI000C78F471|nr:competence type IV pilus minor pilin ComGG [Bacillus sp. T33-2]PLR99922.1 hypothetical protein CVD19_02395 [Bacillus sp. T33-2]
MNEKGFTYPVSICLLMFFSFTLVINLQQYVTEKRFNKETETILKQEYYMMGAVRQVERLLKDGTLQGSSGGTIQYRTGEVIYEIKPLTASTDQITFRLKLDTNEESIGFANYDKEMKKMTKWVERN